MPMFDVTAAMDGDVYRDEVEAANQAEAESAARTQLAEAWRMADTLARYRDEGDEEGFDGELDGFAVDPREPTPGMDDRLSSYDYQLIADALDVLDPDGSEQTSRKSELEAWARAMAAAGTGYLPKASNGAGELAAAGDALAELLEDALTTHIYDFDNGDEQPEDCGYKRGLDTWKAARAAA